VPANADGVSVESSPQGLGLTTAAMSTLSFKDVALDASALLGTLGDGWLCVEELVAGGRILAAAVAVGIATRALDEASRYSLERQQFGQPIARFQAIQNKLADMATDVDAARLLMLRASHSEGRRQRVHASMASAFAAEAVRVACDEAVQVHGGYGYTREFPVERLWRESHFCAVCMGGVDFARVQIATGAE